MFATSGIGIDWIAEKLYFTLDTYTDIAFLDAMGICFFTVLAVMYIVGRLKPLEKPIEFKSNTTMELETSQPAKIIGFGVILATIALYVVFW